MNATTGGAPIAPPILNETVLRSLGLMTPTMLAAKAAEAPAPFLVEGLIYERSVNLVVGDSGIGKTPLLVTLATAVAGHRPFLNHAVKQGRVLYLDAEMSPGDFTTLQKSIAKHMGLTEPPPDFVVWSLYGSDNITSNVEASLEKQIEMFRPSLVIVDPLRTFFPKAEKVEDSPAVFDFQKRLSQKYGAAWVLLHHRRKENAKAQNPPDLILDPFHWFQEAAGARALVNHSDLRLGIEAASAAGADLIVGGFRRGAGPLAPMHIGRVYDDAENPVGYELLKGVSTLKFEHQNVYSQLAPQFKFGDVKPLVGGKSDSRAALCIDAFLAAQVVRKEGTAKQTTYHKTA
jgi:AAA domain-containing protein